MKIERYLANHFPEEKAQLVRLLEGYQYPVKTISETFHGMITGVMMQLWNDRQLHQIPNNLSPNASLEFLRSHGESIRAQLQILLRDRQHDIVDWAREEDMQLTQPEQLDLMKVKLQKRKKKDQ